jgi:hypothetical protein
MTTASQIRAGLSVGHRVVVCRAGETTARTLAGVSHALAMVVTLLSGSVLLVSSTSLEISLRGVGPARGRLCDVLNPHREMEPVEHMIGRTGAGGFAERSWTIGTIAQPPRQPVRPTPT